MLREALVRWTMRSPRHVWWVWVKPHAKHETFELKRALTMHLIRNHGYRLVAYEQAHPVRSYATTTSPGATTAADAPSVAKAC